MEGRIKTKKPEATEKTSEQEDLGQERLPQVHNLPPGSYGKRLLAGYI